MTTRTTSAWAASHLHFSSGPVDVRVVLLQPGMPHDHVLPPQASDSKEGTFRVVLVPKHQFHHLSDGACLVQSAVDVLDWNQVGEGSSGESISLDITSVNEHSSHPRVQERSDGLHFTGINGLELNIEG